MVVRTDMPPPPHRSYRIAPDGTAVRDADFRHFAALAGLVVLLAVGVVLALVYGDAALSGDTAGAWLAGLGAWGALAIVFLMVLHCLVPFPAELLALAAGAAFGSVLGTLLVWTGAMLGAALSFWLSRRLGRRAVERLLPARHRASLDRWTEEQGAMTLLVSRFIPLIAFNLINYAAGLTRVSWWTFLWTTAIGILPITALSVWLGARMATLEWPVLLAVSAAGIAAIWACHGLAQRWGVLPRR